METEGDPETQRDREVQNDQVMSPPKEMMAKEPANVLIVVPQAQVPQEPSVHSPKSLEDVETGPGRNPLNPVVCRQMFRNFHFKDASGPRDVFRNLLELLRQWLRPDIHTKEQMIEMLVHEQFQVVMREMLRAQEQKCPSVVRFTG